MSFPNRACLCGNPDMSKPCLIYEEQSCPHDRIVTCSMDVDDKQIVTAISCHGCGLFLQKKDAA